MNDSPSLLAIFAHPDDESIVAGGTLAMRADDGWRTALICATRGEWGPISDPSLADYETLGDVRERELRAACATLGISWLQFLDLEDGSVGSIAGTEEEDLALEKLVRAIRELQPRTVVTFGEDGLYGHEDHVAVGRLATRACSMAADPEVFPHHFDRDLALHRVPELLYATVPHGWYTELANRLGQSACPADLWGIPPEQFGVPVETISKTVEISRFLDRKLAAIRCHRTQIDNGHAFFSLSADLASRFFNKEFFLIAR